MMRRSLARRRRPHRAPRAIGRAGNDPHARRRHRRLSPGDRDGNVDAGWTGSVQSCTVGTEAQPSLDATLDSVNTLRSFAGLQPVTFDPSFNHLALSAALMMKAANSLSHTPGPDWPCYSDDGAMGAGSSNLYLGLSGAQAMVGYVDDDGVGSLGHRRWVIDPGATVFGSGSTGTTNALKVFGDARRRRSPAGTEVSWPPAGYVPWDWVFNTWSLALGGDSDASEFNVDNAQVQVSMDGQPLHVTNVQTLDDGYGTGHTFSWNVAVPNSATDRRPRPEGDDRRDHQVPARRSRSPTP